MLTLQTLVQQQATTSAAQYTQYTSKKALLACSTFTAINAQLTTAITQLKNCFSFSLHNSKKYLICTMYFAATKQYSYYVVCTATCNVLQQCTSIKAAKQAVATAITAAQQAAQAKTQAKTQAATTTTSKSK